MKKTLTKKIAVLLVNLGTPEKPYKEEVREYLKQFLSDEDVIRLPRLIWLPILYGFVLPLRSKKSALRYQKIWTEWGSPLLYNSYSQSGFLQKKLDDHEAGKYHVEVAMRYGKPSIESKLQKLRHIGLGEIIFIPLFPQYSTTTTQSIAKEISNFFIKNNANEMLKKINFKLVLDFHAHSLYIKAAADKIRKFQKQKEVPDKLLFSYHGIPKSYIGPDEPYEEQCYKTAELIAEYLKIDKSSYEVVFQSRLGKSEWLRPYLSERLKELPQEGIKNIQIFCPGFVSDCLETLGEIEQEAKTIFLNSNGEKFDFITCLNSGNGFIELLKNIVVGGDETIFSPPFGWCISESDNISVEIKKFA